jgi:hypothetical protein
VRVPVLSKIIAPTLLACSRAAAFLYRMPFIAPRPVPTMIAVGVARPSASGQAMMTTVIARVMAKIRLAPATQYQPTKVTRPKRTAAATSHCEARSARRCAGALEFCASCTSLTICASAVSAPTLVARKRKVPVLLMVAPMTSSPGLFSTGTLSPVIMDSSTLDSPSVTTPSTGILSPGRIRTMSSITTSEVGTSSSCPSRMTVAMGGARSRSARIASDAPARALISIQCPNSTNASRTTEAS